MRGTVAVLQFRAWVGSYFGDNGDTLSARDDGFGSKSFFPQRPSTLNFFLKHTRAFS